MKKIARILAIVATAPGPGCAAELAHQHVKERAAFDFQCSATDITVIESGAKCTMIASGCGKEAAYVALPLHKDRWHPVHKTMCCPEADCIVTLNSDVRQVGGSGKASAKMVSGGTYEYTFTPSSPELEDAEREIVEMVLAAEWSEDGPTNYEATRQISKIGVWSATPMDMWKYEIVFKVGKETWHRMVDLNTEEVRFLATSD